MSWLDKAGGFEWLRTLPGNPASQNGYDRLERLYNVNKNPSKWSYQDLQNALDRGTGRSWRDDPNGQMFVNDWLGRRIAPAAAPAPAATAKPKKAPSKPPPTPFDKRLGTIKTQHNADTASLSKSIKTQKNQYATAASSNKNDSVIKSLQKQIAGWDTKYNNLVTSSQKTLNSLKSNYDNTIDSLKGGYEGHIEDLISGFNSKYSGLEASYADNINNLNSKYSGLEASYADNINNLKNSFETQIGGLNKQIESYQHSYNPTTAVGTSARTTSFEVPESTAGQLGIRNKGTSQFNRKVRNDLKITGVQL